MLLGPAALAAYLAASTAPEACADGAAIGLMVSPLVPHPGSTVHFLAVSEQPFSATTWVVHGGPPSIELPIVMRGGPPYHASATAGLPAAGNYRVELKDGAHTLACKAFRVERNRKPPPGDPASGAWPTRAAWSTPYENLFSAWVELLFDAPPDEPLEFRPLAQALRDPHRNFLFDHRGLGEDDSKNPRALPAAPDCADLPYFLRAYFAWKMQLPFAFRDCDRGTATRPPHCGPPRSNEAAAAPAPPLDAFRAFLRTMSNVVQSGAVRTALSDEESDFVALALDRHSLRPGTIYADPYGHVLVVAGFVPQSRDKPGRLLAVDGQPDTSIGRKRFWEGNFLFASDLPGAGAGFKAFRTPAHAAGSNEQTKLAPEKFYARMAALINPDGIDAMAAYDETLSALVEQLQARVRSIDNGEKFMRENPGAVVEMPVGPSIFETEGAWEDYATPSRDLRILIAMKTLLAMPGQVTAHPEQFRLGGKAPAMVRQALEERHKRMIQQAGIDYRRSDGSQQHLPVAALLDRRKALELAYNPNDCVELRWGAAKGSAENTTCIRHAPDEQHARMEEYRAWFADTRRPPRP